MPSSRRRARPPALLIGDVADCDWRELGAALREQLGDVPVVAYGSGAVADQLIAALGPRLQRLQFPFKHAALAAALRVPVEATLEEAGDCLPCRPARRRPCAK